MLRCAVVAICLGGCTLGVGVGGAYSVPSSEIRPGGFHGRTLAGAGWGSRYGNLSAIGGISVVGSRTVASIGAETAIALGPWREAERRIVRGPALLGRALYGGGEDVRVTELAIGAGIGGFQPGNGPGAAGIYLTTSSMTDELGRHGRSYGIELVVSGAIGEAFEKWAATGFGSY